MMHDLDGVDIVQEKLDSWILERTECAWCHCRGQMTGGRGRSEHGKGDTPHSSLNRSGIRATERTKELRRGSLNRDHHQARVFPRLKNQGRRAKTTNTTSPNT